MNLDIKHSPPIRILHVVTYMGRGGLETMIMNYYRHIDRNLVQFDFLVHREFRADYDDEIEAMGGRIYRLPRLNPFSLSYRKTLSTFFANHPEYKVVHCHLDCMAAIPLKAARKSGIPKRIAHSHGSNQNHNLKFLIKLFYRRLIPAVATDLFACSQKAGEWMFNGAPFTIMRNAIDANQFRFDPIEAQRMKAKLELQNCFTVGHVGQFREEKNHLFLIDVFAQILKHCANGRLLLVGKGPMMEPAVAKAAELGISDKVLFLGARSDIPDLMQAMDVFVLPSIHEGFPVTTVEAQAAGLPCVISSGVPIECKLTDPIDQLPLSDGADAWASRILQFRNYDRTDTYPIIQAAGFDIKSNAQWLEEFYCNAYFGN